MATNTTKFKSRKGAQPPNYDTPDAIAEYAREAKEPVGPLQVRVPKSTLEGFSEMTGQGRNTAVAKQRGRSPSEEY